MDTNPLAHEFDRAVAKASWSYEQRASRPEIVGSLCTTAISFDVAANLFSLRYLPLSENMDAQFILVLIGALIGGFVLGLTGFGNGPTAYGIWLHFLAPQVSAPLAAIGSVAGHLVMFRGFRRAMLRDRVLPLVIGGLAGVPIGVWLLTLIPVDLFRLLGGLLLTTYCMMTLVGGHRIRVSDTSPRRDAVVGFLGGVCGGLASLSGPIVTIWSGMKNWSPDEQRAAYQPYNFAILSAALVGFASAGFLTWELAYLAVWTLPATIVGVLGGRACYGYVNAKQFRQIVLVLLAVSGCALILRSF